MPDGTIASEQASPAPKHLRLRDVAPRISAADAADLRWYHSDPSLAGITESTFGAMLERAELFAFGVRMCKRCGGDAKTDKAGTGFAPVSRRSYAEELETYRQKQAKKAGVFVVTSDFDSAVAVMLGLGMEQKAVPKATWDALFPELGLEMCEVCRKCGGFGVIPRASAARRGEITANTTGSSKDGNPNACAAVDELALMRYGRISRRLRDVAAQGALLAEVGRRYYSPAGGSTDCLWDMVEDGAALLTENPHGLSMKLLVQNIREADRKRPETDKDKRLARASRATAELFEEFCKAWNRTAPGVA